ncbi:50S ribosomal protein L6, partial [Candidatus Bathyarchaeota archaeon]
MSLTTTVVESHVEIPEGVEVRVEGRRVTVKGRKGSLTRDLPHTSVNIEHRGDIIRVSTGSRRKRERAVVKTIAALIRNMIKG